MDSGPPLRFDNSFLRDLPADPVPGPGVRAVNGAAYSLVSPTPVAAPKVVACAREVADLLGFRADDCEQPWFAEVFAGNRLLPGMVPYAACYGGHQFGSWAGQLGDGRAISLGEVIAPAGGRWELQLKGAGRTPYSRSGDGRAVMRSSVREFLCSEAMFHLGVPSTRALSLVATGEEVMRDILYDGHPRMEPGAVVCRVAPTFIRFGNFEIFAARQDLANLRRLADYTIDTHFHELGGPGDPGDARYVKWFAEVCRRTAAMIVHWMRVGFVHGVMNTDNMSILGLTIDYGPYGWLEGYDPNWTPNTTDAGRRRYRFGAQPRVAMWNLVQLANALVPLTEGEDPAPFERALQDGAEALSAGYDRMLAAKLGLLASLDQDGRVEADRQRDRALCDQLFEVLAESEIDMTILYRALAQAPLTEAPLAEAIREAAYDPAALAPGQPAGDKLAAWLQDYRQRAQALGLSDEERRRRMNAVNPKYVLRNYQAQLAIDAAEKGDHSKVVDLLEVLRRPYDEQPGREAFAEKRPEWARNRPGCSMLSCSS